MTRLLVIASLLCSIGTPAFAQWKLLKTIDRISKSEHLVVRLPAKAAVGGVTATIEVACFRPIRKRLPALMLSRAVAEGEFGVTVVMDGEPFPRTTRSYVDPGHFALFNPIASDLDRASRLQIQIHPRRGRVISFDFDVRGFAVASKGMKCE